LEDIQKKLAGTMESLCEWDRNKFGSVNKEIKALKDRMGRLQNGDYFRNQTEIESIKVRLDEILLREEIMWRQRSRVVWLKEGEQNTSFFHRKASGRAKKNKISKLRRADGTMASKEEEFVNIANGFFSDLYKKDDDVNPAALLEAIQPVVTDKINADLLADLSEQEIGDALFQIGPLKAPGPDGLPARFFQRNWALLKGEICNAIELFFKEGVFPDNFNLTKIILIPKSTDAMGLKDYSPISLCNVIYKIIAKCMVNKLRPHLHGLISENQSAFIPGRLKSDNALIAFECFHAIHCSKKEDGSFCAYKMDLTKAYDRVEWSFLEESLLKWGFDRRWVGWIMACVKSVKFRVQINEQLTKDIFPTRGLR
jgi:hypothetical protein